MIDRRVATFRICILGCGHLCVDNLGCPGDLSSEAVRHYGSASVCCLCKRNGEPWWDCVVHNKQLKHGTHQAKV